jgi:hypothetical protein
MMDWPTCFEPTASGFVPKCVSKIRLPAGVSVTRRGVPLRLSAARCGGRSGLAPAAIARRPHGWPRRRSGSDRARKHSGTSRQRRGSPRQSPQPVPLGSEAHRFSPGAGGQMDRPRSDAAAVRASGRIQLVQRLRRPRHVTTARDQRYGPGSERRGTGRSTPWQGSD